ncbi:MAG TPA: universal stress protein [Candidatus Tectomicrobia bacterium]|nr:universal stress protein [Candidatus Tectomicrobia bacterium]
MELRKILIPIDFSDHSRQALGWGVSLAKKYGAQLLLLHVIPEVLEEVSARESAGEELVIGLTAEIEAQLQEIVHQEVRQGGSAQAKVVDGEPAEAILRVAREEAVDLIVMGTHGRSGLPHILLGSTAEAVVRAAPCPVFTVRPSREFAP